MPAEDADHPAILLDVQMLTVTAGGRERTEAQYSELVSKAGLHLDRVHAPIPGLPSMLYVRKATAAEAASVQ